MDLLDLIKARRSIRRYHDKDVSNEVVNKIIEAGIWAPSSNHCEPCEFIVVRDKSTKDQLAKISPWSRFIAHAPVAICVISNKASNCAIIDGSIAAMNMLLEIHALGLGTCWVDTQYNEKFVRDLLNVADNYEVITVLPIGHPAENPSSSRKSLAECVHKEGYGNR